VDENETGGMTTPKEARKSGLRERYLGGAKPATQPSYETTPDAALSADLPEPAVPPPVPSLAPTLAPPPLTTAAPAAPSPGERQADQVLLVAGLQRSSGADAALTLAGALSILLGLAFLLVQALGLGSLPVAIRVVALAAAVGLACLMLLLARLASTSRRTKVILFVSIASLVIATANLAVALPSLITIGGPGTFIGNALGSLWTVALFAAVALFTRTLPWRALLGFFFAGFFGISALAVLIGKPVVAALGDQSAFATAVFVPITEEALKLLPALALLLLARRQAVARPSIGDVVLVGTAIGAGFGLYENTLFGRSGGGGLFDTLPASLVIPSIHSGFTGGVIWLVGGHIVYTALASMALAVWLLYWRRFRWAWVVVPLILGDVVLEHMSVNQLGLLGFFGEAPWWVQVTAAVTFRGGLSVFLLTAGLVAATALETWKLGLRSAHAAASPAGLIRLLVLAPGEVARRAAILAAMQTGRPSQPESANPPPPPATQPIPSRQVLAGMGPEGNGDDQTLGRTGAGPDGLGASATINGEHAE
jgi:hypothetical protein